MTALSRFGWAGLFVLVLDGGVLPVEEGITPPWGALLVVDWLDQGVIPGGGGLDQRPNWR